MCNKLLQLPDVKITLVCYSKVLLGLKSWIKSAGSSLQDLMRLKSMSQLNPFSIGAQILFKQFGWQNLIHWGFRTVAVIETCSFKMSWRLFLLLNISEFSHFRTLEAFLSSSSDSVSCPNQDSLPFVWFRVNSSEMLALPLKISLPSP